MTAYIIKFDDEISREAEEAESVNKPYKKNLKKRFILECYKKRFSVLLISILLSLSGCALAPGSTFEADPSRKYNDQELAIIEANSRCRSCIQSIFDVKKGELIYDVSGFGPPYNFWTSIPNEKYATKFRLMPGKYTLSLRYRGHDLIASVWEETVQLRKGNKYVVDGTGCYFTPRSQSFVWLENKNNKDVVMGKKPDKCF